MAVQTVRVKGLRELQRALKNVDDDMRKEIDVALREAAQKVAEDARSKFAGIDARSASGFRPRIRGFGRVVVEQRLRRTTGQHPEFGSLQMRRALIPALGENQEHVIDTLDHLLDTLGRRNGF